MATFLDISTVEQSFGCSEAALRHLACQADSHTKTLYPTQFVAIRENNDHQFIEIITPTKKVECVGMNNTNIIHQGNTMTDKNYPELEDKINSGSANPARITLINPKADDTLRYTVYVSKALAQDTVRISTTVTVLVHPQDTIDKVLTERVEPVLNDFISGDWVIRGLDRRSDAVGYERVTMRASARVAFAENFNLADRARAANREGISISDPDVDRSSSPEKVTQAVKELWFKIIENVNMQIPQFNELTGRVWRIGDVEYGAPDRGSEARFSKGSSRSEVDQFYSELDDPSVKQGGERISLTANVTLRADAA